MQQQHIAIAGPKINNSTIDSPQKCARQDQSVDREDLIFWDITFTRKVYFMEEELRDQIYWILALKGTPFIKEGYFLCEFLNS